MNHVLEFEELDTTQHLYLSRPALGCYRLELHLPDYCCHVSLSRVNGCRDDLDQGNWDVFKNNVEVGFRFVSLGTFDEILSLDLEERRGAVIPA